MRPFGVWFTVKNGRKDLMRGSCVKDNSTVVTGGRGMRGGRRGKGSQVHGDEGDWTLGEHSMQYTDEVLQNCIWETYIMVSTNVIPNKLNF